MNKEEILAMEAGRNLNLLIMEKVMGLIAWEEKRGEYTHIVFQKPEDKEPYKSSRNWEKEMDKYKRIEYSEINNHIHVVQDIKAYSSDISAAWEVVEKFINVQIEFTELFEGHKSTSVQIHLANYPEEKYSSCSATAYSAPEAICKAALLAVMDS